MEKLRRILLCGLAVVASAATMHAQTLTQDWKVTEGLPVQSEARWGVGFNGKIYTNFKAQKSVLAFENGSNPETVIPTGKSGAGVGISHDSKGNLIIVNGWAGAGAMKSFVLWNKETNTVKAINITMPEGVEAARMDYIGRAVGDIFSEDGGALFIIGTGKQVAAKIFISNGEYVADKSKPLPTLPFAADATTIIQPLTDNPESDDVAVRLRGNKNFYTYDGSEWKAYTNAGSVSMSSGGDLVTLNGTLYTIEPSGTNYYDGFQIVDRSTNTVVATHEKSSVENKNTYGTALSVEKIDEYTARIYQYHAGGFAAQYTFSLPKPKMYILGQNEEGEAWNPTSGIEMTWEKENVWTANVTTSDERQNIAFVSVLAENNDDGGWSYVNANRYGLAIDNQDGALAENLTVSKNTNAVSLGVGSFFIRLNLNDNTLYVVPTKLYAIGNTNKADNHGWDPDDDSYMAECDPGMPGVFTFSPIDMKVQDKAVGEEDEDDLSYFAFVTCLDSNWNLVNGNRWCPGNTTVNLENNVAHTGFGKNFDGNFSIKNGAYDLTVDLNTKTITAVYLTATSVEKVSGDSARAVAADGKILIIGEAANVSVYNIAGQAVALNTSERAIAVPRGLYVVTIDGQTAKVIVR